MPDNSRELLKREYPNKNWARKVDKMSESQVAAVLLRIKASKKK